VVDYKRQLILPCKRPALLRCRRRGGGQQQRQNNITTFIKNPIKEYGMRTGSLTTISKGLFFGGAVFTSLMMSDNSSAASFDINLSNRSAQLRYATVIGGSTLGRTESSVSFLYNDDDKYVLDFGVLVIDVAGSKSPGLEVGVGPKLYYADGEKGQALAVGLGGQLRYKIPALERVNFGLDGYYAPNIVSFADAKNMHEVDLRVGYEILPTADVYLGYRRIHVGFDKGEETVDESTVVGLKMSF
jgi:hypothetical protein